MGYFNHKNELASLINGYLEAPPCETVTGDLNSDFLKIIWKNKSNYFSMNNRWQHNTQ